MFKEDALIGVIAIYRQEVRPFTDKQIAAAAETSPPRPSSPSRTRGCSTNCENPCSSRPPPADVLKVISRSTFDLQTVLDTVAEVGSSTLRSRLRIYVPARRRSLSWLLAAATSPELDEYLKQHPIRSRRTVARIAARTRSKARTRPYSRCSGRSGIHISRGSETGGYPHDARRPNAYARTSRSASWSSDASDRSGHLPTSKSSW